MKVRFNLYEVNNFDDEEKTFDDLRKAGCKSLYLIARDWEEGMIRVECELPEGVTSTTQLKLEVARNEPTS
jgi:hypothetical protein